MAAKRVVYFVQWDKSQEEWIVKLQGGNVVKRLMTQEHAISHARKLCKQHELSQIKLKGKDGLIRMEFTYGADPRKTKG